VLDKEAGQDSHLGLRDFSSLSIENGKNQNIKVKKVLKSKTEFLSSSFKLGVVEVFSSP